MFCCLSSKKKRASKYALNGSCVYENFEYSRHLSYPHFSIGRSADIDFKITLREKIQNDRDVLYPVILSYNLAIVRARYYFNVRKANGSSAFTVEDEDEFNSAVGVWGCRMDFDKLMNGGFLEDGGLKVEYGFHVEAILEGDGVWNFNFGHSFFNDNHYIVNNFKYGDRKQFYCHKQIINFHLNLNAPTLDCKSFYADYILQMAHGVRKQRGNMELKSLVKIFEIAKCHKIWNVARLVELQLIYQYVELKRRGFGVALHSDQPHLLAHYLRLMTRRRVIRKLKNCRIEEMTGETMKQLTRFILEL